MNIFPSASLGRQAAFLLALVTMLLLAPAVTCAQHADVLLQDVDGRLVSGSADFTSGQWTLGKRVYSGEFDSFHSTNNPGFNSLAASSPSMPAGSGALPGNRALGWDFLPMKIDGALANLFYWDGVGSSAASVNFGALPGPEYRLEIYGRNQTVGVDGSPAPVPGDVIEATSSSGSIHSHRYFYLDSGNQNAAGPPADGIYLMSIGAKMTGLDASAPIYFVFGTPGSTLAALQAAESWVNNRVDELAPDFNADFNGDWRVDGSDFLIWQRNLGATNALLKAGDADRDGSVGAGDLAIWKEEFGLSLATFPGATSSFLPAAPGVHAVPEPCAAVVATCAGIALIAATRFSGGCRCQRAKRHPNLPPPSAPALASP